MTKQWVLGMYLSLTCPGASRPPGSEFVHFGDKISLPRLPYTTALHVVLPFRQNKCNEKLTHNRHGRCMTLPNVKDSLQPLTTEGTASEAVVPETSTELLEEGLALGLVVEKIFNFEDFSLPSLLVFFWRELI